MQIYTCFRSICVCLVYVHILSFLCVCVFTSQCDHIIAMLSWWLQRCSLAGSEASIVALRLNECHSATFCCNGSSSEAVDRIHPQCSHVETGHGEAKRHKKLRCIHMDYFVCAVCYQFPFWCWGYFRCFPGGHLINKAIQKMYVSVSETSAKAWKKCLYR
jgi:hypothetical protein